MVKSSSREMKIVMMRRRNKTRIRERKISKLRRKSLKRRKNGQSLKRLL
jgi:hypothetical protein